MKKANIMRRVILAILLMFSSGMVIYAQDKGRAFYKQPYKARNSGSFSSNTGIVSIGYGIPNHNGYGYLNAYRNAGGFGPLYVKYEHGIIDEVGIGGYFAFAGSYHRNNHRTWRNAAFSIGLLGYYHFNKLIPVEKLDVYVGLGFAARIVTYSNDHGAVNNKTDASPIPLGKLGARWYFTPGFGVYLETGYDNMSSLNLGVTFKF